MKTGVKPEEKYEVKLEDLKSCLQGVYPSTLYTCAADGTPNVNYISHVYYVDQNHVAISGQFLNKTRKNIAVNPMATAMVLDPVNVCHVELLMRWKESQTSGNVFSQISERIKAIDSQVGGEGKFSLKSVEIFEVLDIKVPEEFHYLLNQKNHKTLFSLNNLQSAIQHIQKANTLENLYDLILESLEKSFGFKHSLLLIPDSLTNNLITINTRGYNLNGVGAEVKIGEGIIGKVAQAQKPLAFMGLKREYIYAQTSLRNYSEMDKEIFFSEAIALPKLTDAASIIAVPLINRGKLAGVLEVQSLASVEFKESDEDFMMTFGSYVAMAMENLQIQNEPETFVSEPLISETKAVSSLKKINITYYIDDECIFIDGEYLIRSLPAKILWKLIQAFLSEGKTEFSNRELRMDKTLQLPDFKDNLETRLILLRKRLEAKNPGIALKQNGRGKFKIEIHGQIILDVL